jgi:hypothetical protein
LVLIWVVQLVVQLVWVVQLVFVLQAFVRLVQLLLLVAQLVVEGRFELGTYDLLCGRKSEKDEVCGLEQA